MTTVYQIVFGSNGETVVNSLNNAFHHILHNLCPNEADRNSLLAKDEYPLLAAADAGGSFFHRVIWETRLQRREALSVIAHDTETRAPYVTSREEYSLADEFDPSYLVQAALYHAESTDEDLSEIGADLNRQISKGVKTGQRFGEPAEKFVARLRRYQEMFGGPAVIPAQGKPEAILKALPAAAEALFHSVAAKAFKEEPGADPKAAPGLR